MNTIMNAKRSSMKWVSLLVLSICLFLVGGCGKESTSASKSTQATPAAQPSDPAQAAGQPTATSQTRIGAGVKADDPPIFAAARDDDVTKAKAIIETDPRAVNAKNQSGLTPLALIARSQRLTFAITSYQGALKAVPPSDVPVPLVAELLIAKGADINAKDNESTTPLTLAILTQKPALAELLVAKGADVNAKDDHGGTPLLWAIGKQMPSLAKLLIKKGADVNVVENLQDYEGYTPLHLAAVYDDLDTATELLAAGSTIDMKDKNGETPLFVAARQGQYPIVDLLLQRKADVNARDAKGRTPLAAVNATLRSPGKRNDASAAAYKKVAALLQKNGGKE